MKARIILLLGLLVLPFTLESAPNIQVRIKKAQKQMKDLRAEVKELKEDLRALENSEKELAREYLDFESSLKAQMRKRIVPLWRWMEQPEPLNLSFDDWLGRAHRVMVLRAVRKQLVQAPAQLLKERADRLTEIQGLREETANRLSLLETKRSFLKVQLDEWKALQRAEKAAAKPQ